jgi:dipeptidyl aminopeptidase/acylaminoacyl peptidase
MRRPILRGHSLIGLGLAAFLVIGAGLTAVPGASAQAPGQKTAKMHPFSVQDMLAMDRISDSQVSPDGRSILFNLRETDLSANRGRTDLWIVGTDGQGLRRLTSNPASDFNGRWAPDGKSVYFLSTRSGSAQPWRIRPDAGEAEPVTKLPLDAANLIVSPDGSTLAFTMQVFPGQTPDESAKKLEETAARKATGRLYDRLFVRHWDTWTAADPTSSSCPPPGARPGTS